MLQSVEIVPAVRTSLRRSVRLGCEITSDLAGPRRETLVDLSPRGARVLTDLEVERGEHVLIGFAAERLGRRVETIARVAHVDREPLMRPSIGLEFVDLDPEIQVDLRSHLRGVPPPLPAQITRPARELVWIEMLVTWEEDLGDQVNVWEVSESMAAIDDGDLVIETLAPFVTGGATGPRWIH